MNTQYLRYAIEIERAGSISGAAANLYMAQPNLSKAIKDMEKEIGYAVFIRTSSGIKITDKGTEFLYHAHKMLEQLDEIEKIADKSDELSGRYKMSIPRGSYIANGFTSLVSELAENEKLEITINETNTMHTIENVTDKGYNAGIIRYPIAEEEYFYSLIRNNKLSAETIWEFEYVLVMSKDHPLANKEKINPEDLVGYMKITHGDIETPHEKNMSKDKKAPKDDKVIFVYERGSQFDLLANVPTTYMWVSPIPQNVLDKNGLIQRACKSVHNRYKDVLIYRKDYQLGEFDKLFQKKLYESKVEVASQKYN